MACITFFFHASGDKSPRNERRTTYLCRHLREERAEETPQKEEEKEPAHEETQTETLHAQTPEVGLLFLQTISQ